MVIIAEWESRRGRRKGKPRTESDSMGMEIRRAINLTRRGRVRTIGHGNTWGKIGVPGQQGLRDRGRDFGV